MIATPASLIALLRAVSVSWQQHAQTENAREIAASAQELFERVLVFSKHFEKIRGGLEQASKAYNDAVGSYESRVRPSGEKLLKLGGDLSGKALAETAPVETMLAFTPVLIPSVASVFNQCFIRGQKFLQWNPCAKTNGA